jgi:hypothetical protein
MSKHTTQTCNLQQDAENYLNNYFLVPKAMLQDKNLTYAAKGLFVYLLSFSPDEQPSNTEIAVYHGCSIYEIQELVTELMNAGYDLKTGEK